MSTRDDVFATARTRAGHTLRLPPDAAGAFVAALSRPAQVNQALLRALGVPQNFGWLD